MDYKIYAGRNRYFAYLALEAYEMGKAQRYDKKQ